MYRKHGFNAALADNTPRLAAAASNVDDVNVPGARLGIADCTHRFNNSAFRAARI